MELHFSTSFHPQTDGQTERVNALLKCYLRHYVSAHQKDWARLLDITQFLYSLQRSESTGQIPFELAIGQQPQTPHSLPAAFKGKCLGAYHMAKGWEEQLDTTKSYLYRAAKVMKKFADREWRPIDYRVGDMVKVKFNSRQFKALRGMHPNLIRNMLKPYHEDKDDPSRGQSSRAPITIISSHDREIEAIMDYQDKEKQGQKDTIMFLVHWKGESQRRPRGNDMKIYDNSKITKIREFMQQHCAVVVATFNWGECDDPYCYHAT
ncbi:uncharacterized protein [Nicotiana sylvestris]|uniref:Uncharacterized protein LOC104235428 n=1 Tax=Nicotiana sylvestris TaxID=4096 RepID=A0A1U7X9F9_NICSY|nr:PREDICTED: uncharacterized protein LOC104235428 [Nicotiana sylvestris]